MAPNAQNARNPAASDSCWCWSCIHFPDEACDLCVIGGHLLDISVNHFLCAIVDDEGIILHHFTNRGIEASISLA
jgi:hypothetical protein